MKKLPVVLMVLLAISAAAFAAEKSGVVLLKTSTPEKKGETEIRVYIDTNGDGITDTVLGFEKKAKPKENETVLVSLDEMIKEGSIITFYSDHDTKAKKSDFVRIIWHDLISIDGVSLAQKFPNPYWFQKREESKERHK